MRVIGMARVGRSVRSLLVLAVGLAAAVGVSVAGERLPVADMAAMAKKYGRPDVDFSTEKEKPRPLIVTRRWEYKKAGVVWVFVADAAMGAPPPYKQWLLMGAMDLKTKNKVTAEEADRRIAELKRSADTKQ